MIDTFTQNFFEVIEYTYTALYYNNIIIFCTPHRILNIHIVVLINGIKVSTSLYYKC